MKPIPDGFRGTAIPLSKDAYEMAGMLWKLDPNLIRTIAKVESRGSGFDTQGRPKMLFERHWFRKFTNGRYDKSHPSISNIKPGGYTIREYNRMDEALKLDLPAALKSASWGRFQIMGFNHQACGYMGPVPFVAAMCESENNQLDAFMKFITAMKIIQPLRDHNWREVARLYNGTAYEKNEYHTKLEEAYKSFSA